MGTQSTSFTDIQNSLDALTKAQQQVSSDVSSAIADIQALSTQVSTLQAQGGAEPDDLAALKTSIDQITTSLTGVSSSLESVLPEPAPATSPDTSPDTTQ
jgi:peptidoglycan hydrolase CwlO-like protein